MYQGIPRPDPSSLADLKADHLRTLSAPLDAYWEQALIGFSDHYEISIDGVRAGFYCIDSDQQLVGFYLAHEFANHGDSVLSNVIDDGGVSNALAGTNDPYFLSLCMDVAKSCKVHSLLFEDAQTKPSELSGMDAYSFERATDEDLPDIFEHYRACSGSMDIESVETGFDNLKGYIRSMLDEHHIFVLRDDRTLIATSECRISKTQEPFADVGMIVAEDRRCHGVGGHILARTKAFCYERNVRPICSCEASNSGSRKAIRKAGFVSRHRIVLIELDVDRFD